MNNKKYEFIGKLALALYSQKIKIKLGTLVEIMKENGWSYGSNRGMAKAASAAYRYWEAKANIGEHVIEHHAIAYTFTNQDGKLPWI